MSVNGDFTIIADEADAGRRLDAAVAVHIADCSRSLAASLINGGHILVDGRPRKPGYRLKAGDSIQGRIPAPAPAAFAPEPIPLDIIYQDQHIAVINKPPGLVVHPAPGHAGGTLVNALLYHCPDLGAIGGGIRPGIVHRLDKETSGTMVIAKNQAAHEELSRQFKAREIRKKYLALVYGEPSAESGSIQLPIGRHPVDRKRMSTTTRRGRQAETLWKIREQLDGATLLEIILKTGRTHQIRVHCAAMGHPVVGDPVYRPRRLMANLQNLFPNLPATVVAGLKSVPRQMLHSWQLGLIHPVDKKLLIFESPVPSDMAEVLNTLRHAKNRLQL
jgi:23S rRNA pseudouridine1911/1915/1917 synthase